MSIKTGDTVVVIAGRDQYTEKDKKTGIKTRKTGRVLKVIGDRVLVQGVNIVKKHQRPTQANDKGGIIEKEAPIHISNVALIDPKTGEATRVGYRIENGEKVRYAKKSGTTIDGKKK